MAQCNTQGSINRAGHSMALIIEKNNREKHSVIRTHVYHYVDWMLKSTNSHGENKLIE